MKIEGYVNAKNCRIWSTGNTFGLEAVPLHSGNESMWFGITESFAVVLFFFDQIDSACHVNVP